MNRLWRPVAVLLAASALLLGAACSSNTAPINSSPASDTPVSLPRVSQPASSSPAATAASNNTSAPAATASGLMSVADVVKLAEPSIVRIETSAGVGSGWVIDSAGYIITNNHVVSSARGRAIASVSVTLSDGSVVDGQVVGADPRSDLALVKIDPPASLPALPVASLDSVQIGDDVVAIGYALDLPGGEGPSFSVTRGIVSQKNRAISETSAILGAIQTDAAINHGNSGGPLINLHGQVVGVNTSLVPDSTTGTAAEGIGLAVGSDTVAAVYQQLKASGQVDRGFLGIQNFEALRPAKARELGIPENTGGVYLSDPSSVAAGGPAEAGGMQSGDVIVNIGGDPIKDEAALAVALIKHHAGETVDVQIYRGGKLQTLKVTLGSSAQ